MPRFATFLLAIATFAAAPVAQAENARVVASASRWAPDAIDAHGPFQVTADGRAVLVGATDARSPAQFAVMLAEHPQIAQLDLVEAPGTYDDVANLQLGHMIRAAGLATHVPANGQVRSGAVELFLAGTTRSIAEGARFAVHAWMDEDGLQANDYPDHAPEHAKYLDFYRAMGFTPDRARSFYAMTNRVPHGEAQWLDAAEMRGWLGIEERVAPRLAFAPAFAMP